MYLFNFLCSLFVYTYFYVKVCLYFYLHSYIKNKKKHCRWKMFLYMSYYVFVSKENILSIEIMKFYEIMKRACRERRIRYYSVWHFLSPVLLCNSSTITIYVSVICIFCSEIHDFCIRFFLHLLF